MRGFLSIYERVGVGFWGQGINGINMSVTRKICYTLVMTGIRHQIINLGSIILMLLPANSCLTFITSLIKTILLIMLHFLFMYCACLCSCACRYMCVCSYTWVVGLQVCSDTCGGKSTILGLIRRNLL